MPPKLSLAAIVLLHTAFAQQTARPGYDIDYIGPPMADPVMQQSKETYVLFGCAYCHGVYLAPRGEATDLMHSRLVGQDVNANLIGPLLRAGIPQTAKLSPMPQFSDLSEAQIAGIARWIHYARQQGHYKELIDSKDLRGGDASAGKAYFEKTCRSCHGTGKEFSATPAAKLLRPGFLDAPPSWKLERLDNAATAAARQRHSSLLENYTPAEVVNLLAYFGSLK